MTENGSVQGSPKNMEFQILPKSSILHVKYHIHCIRNNKRWIIRWVSTLVPFVKGHLFA